MQKLSIYVPASHTVSADVVKTLLGKLSDMAGGASQYEVTGAWMSQFHVLITEPITVVFTLATEDKASAVLTYLQGMARQIKTVMVQEAVLLTVEDIKAAIFVS